ncbi:serine/threonine-protein kinase [Tautonia sociabilis]|uniref:Serine/threonine protein kinase n=1 Tax=Tautonia sociabilis TaxID=2080755 RepID=A0A432MN87_9BACT|nr:serine/threonine-protein kinase [Tautonia sociabilis]RUL88657.1 serine/threonine protein kinase [Tautonia sociabilis]
MIGTTLKRRFLVERELGRGGMGAVYRAIDQTLQRSVAIKMLRELGGEEVGERLRLEARILARLQHDLIVRLYDFDEEDGLFYFIMEEVQGPSYYRRWKSLAIPERLAVLAGVAEALDYAHHQGIIHRDIKPGNVLLTPDDRPKLSDFGLSVVMEQGQETGVARGTPLYMSPEQARGKRLDPRSDLYSLGVLLYEATVGETPFQGSPMAIMAQQVKTAPVPPRSRNPELSAELEGLILRLMAKSPDARPSSGAEVARELRALLEGDGWRASGRSAGEVMAETVAVTAPACSSVPALRDAPAASPARVAAPAPIGSKADAEAMIAEVERVPIALSPEERYLSGHYLAYLLGGSRRRGIFLRRPLDPLNADRARLILAMAWLMLGEPGEAEIDRAARMLDARPDIRPRLSPIVVIKYLRSRDEPAKRKRFRKVRNQLHEASSRAKEYMTDARGLLNPGLMPQVLADLRKIAPDRVAVDDDLVSRWNRLAEIWRARPEFRRSVLRYATLRAADDPVSVDLWPEVVHPLIERALWQRRLRSRAEGFWDAAGRVLFSPPPGVHLDRQIVRSVPTRDVDELDESMEHFQAEPEYLEAALEDDAPASAEPVSGNLTISRESLRAITAEGESSREFVPLLAPDPECFTLGELRELRREAIAALRDRSGTQGHRVVPVGPYRLVVVASVRGNKAGTVAIQGMPNKQIELLVPSMAGGGSGSRPIVAVWHHANRSMVIAHLDQRGQPRYVLWNAAINQQSVHPDVADLNSELLAQNLEAPDRPDRALVKGSWFSGSRS